MDSQNTYPGLNNPSTSTGYYNEGYIPNYYTDNINDNGSNLNYSKMHGMPHTYYEPLFRPPSSMYYSHTYPRHNIEHNSQYTPPAPSPLPGPSSWYHPSVSNQHEQMINMLQFTSSNGREARNRAEKNRRDKLNGSIQELSTMVPHVAESPRRVDKTAVLRFSAHGLRLHYVFGKTINKPPSGKPQFFESLMKMLDSFLISITCRGQIVLIWPSVEQHLGHCQTDLLGQNILHITHPDDHAMLKKEIIPTDLETLFDIQPEDESGEPRPRTQEEEDEIDRKLKADKRNFIVRLARAGPRSEPTTYEHVQIDGCFRRADSAPRGIKTSTFPSGLQLIRRARGRDDTIPLHTISGNDIILVARARIIKPPKICDRLLEASLYEYKTRHLIDGRIIECDQRISLVAGYMTEEVNGLSPFSFMHRDDARWVIAALRQMYDCNNNYGESCYRLLTRTNQFIYLRTRGYLEVDEKTNKVHSFICINTLVSEEEGQRLVQEMKNKFSIIIKTKIPTSAIDAPAAENPHQLEKQISYLIQNLQKSTDEDENENDSQKSVIEGSNIDKIARHTKSPPLALIPPEPETIKSSISKSVDVVNTTIAKTLRLQKQKSPSSSDESNSSSSTTKSDIVTCNQTRPSVLQKNGTPLTKSNGVRNHEEGMHCSSSNQYEESRVPPLPSSKGYFEINTFTAKSSSPKVNEGGIASNLSHLGVVQPKQQNCGLKRIRAPDDYGENMENIPKRRNIEIDKESIGILPSTPLITEVLVNSLKKIGRSLKDIENATTELKGQVGPNSLDQLEEIIEEHQVQTEQLEDIQADLDSVSEIDIAPISEDDPYQQNDLKPR